ncbi:hypothetical protein H1R20_g6952, partial [Candolleomyces eurysporus]
MTQYVPPSPCDLDDEYYWDFVTFSARGRLFRVPKYRLISESEHFANKYALDGDSGSEIEYGTVEDPHLNAVKLDDVSADEFRSFLKAVYPKVVHCDLALSKDEWLSVLKLSTRWLFNNLRKKAIEELACSDLGPIEKIQLGKEYNIEAWLLSGCSDLVSREPVISIEDAEKIDWKVAINLYIIRDGVKTDPLADVHTIDDQVRNAFSTDFERIRSSQSLYLTADEKLGEIREEEERKREVEKRKREVEEPKALATSRFLLGSNSRPPADSSSPAVDTARLSKASSPTLGGEEDKGGAKSDGTSKESAKDTLRARDEERRVRKAMKVAKKKAKAAAKNVEETRTSDIERPSIPEPAEQNAKSEAASENLLVDISLTPTPAYTARSPTARRPPLAERLSKIAPSTWPPVPTTSATGDKPINSPVSSFWS